MRAISSVGLAIVLLLAACGGERPDMGGRVTAEVPEGALPLYDAQSRINVLAPQASILAGSAPKRFSSFPAADRTAPMGRVSFTAGPRAASGPNSMS